MNIIEKKLNFKNPLKTRSKTEWLILHHAYASKCSAEDIHSWHLQRGWNGFGYHFLVRKNGDIETGRPIETVGSHCKDHNHYSIGICFEGNFEAETMNDTQIKAGQELIQMVKDIYKDIKVCRHKDAWGSNTSCPGKNFPFDEVIKAPKKESDIVSEIKKKYAELGELLKQI